MINEIEPHVFNNQFKNRAELSPESPVFIFGDEKPAAVMTRNNRIPLYKDVKGAELDFIYLFNFDGKDAFLFTDYLRDRLDGSFVLRSFKDLRDGYDFPGHEYFLSMTAFQLRNWYMNNRFCGRCGGKTKMSEKERAIVCPSCGNIIYPRIVPAITVAIIDRERDKILLTKYAGRDISFFVLVSGFTEIGETLEETVKREAFEETGLRVKNVTYFASQPWGIVDDLMVGFYCDLDGEPEIVRDQAELKDARWFSREEVELEPRDISLTNALMRAFKDNRI